MFLCCGDALFDLFSLPGDGPATIRLEGRVGGSPLNVAIGLARLGRPVAYFTKNSRDLFGQRIAATLRAEGVDTNLMLEVDNNSTLAVVELDAAGVPAYAFYTGGTADRSLTEAELPASLPPAIRAIHIGSYTTATEPTASSLVALVKREGGRRFISYDPNIRPSIEPDLEVWRRRIASLAGTAHLLKLSAEDAALLFPGQRPEHLAADWIRGGVRMVVVTRGADGAIAFTGGGCSAAVSGYHVEVVDTVGAGDTFQAAMLAWLERHDALTAADAAALDSDDLRAMLNFGARAAAITCGRRGADMPRLGELAHLAW
ncbi:fructokinase [Dongia mobilis]|uniref:Fructokinase n=1 Tax=Dongia mobilis TaxID=578943 RepID=A0A4R6X1U6_9PROT|nr:carbohydrate kinase [Dongia mobilis]TDQ84438.1 fructokinase [Dongia mobilis]